MKKYLTTLLVFVTIAVSAQEFNVSAELRPRYEYRHGYKLPISSADDAANFVSQRTRLNISFKDEKYTLYMAIQNVNVWGDVATLATDSKNGITFHEAWAEYFITPKIAVKLGRQEISYDDQRMFGAVGWAQQARSHDALLVKFKTGENGKLHLGFALNANSETLVAVDYNVNQYKAMQYAWYNTKFSEAVGFSALFLNNGMPFDNSVGEQKVAYSQTIGARATFKKNRFTADAATYFQGGRTPSGLPEGKTDLSSYYFSANAKFRITDQFKVGAGFELLSGNDQDATSTTDKAFKPFYGTNHKFNGFMDYFYVGSHMNSVGLIDFNVPISYSKDKFSILLAPHFFSADGTILNPDTTKADAYLGTEIDLVLGYKVYKNVSLNVGYSQMFGSDSMQVIKGGDINETNNWAWAMITFKPNLFKSKPKS
ncbi:MAG: hypothetical protein QM478_04675 [Flavobacteriaceae bacterium]